MTDSVLNTGDQLASLWDLGGLSWRELGKRIWDGINEHDLINRAYELAFNFVLAIFPLLFFVLALLGFFASEVSKLRGDLFFYLQTVLPPGAYELLVHTLNEITRNRVGGKLVFGLVFALYSGSAGMTQLMSTLNATYAVQEGRSWLRVHLISVALTLAMSILLIAALFLVIAGGQLVDSLGAALGLSAAALIAVKVLQWLFALAFVIFAFATIYFFAPNVDEQHWYWITPGSVVGVALWAISSAALRAYLHFFDSYTATYGSLGTMIILMLWFYVTGLAFLIGSQVNATIEHAAAEHGHIEAKPLGRKKAA
jgi:membrane protein